MISLGILSWGSPKTLTNTLNSYEKSGLVREVDERYIFFQEITEDDLHLAYLYGYEALGSPRNLGIGEGFKHLINHAKYENFLFLENDWVNNETELQTHRIMRAAARAVSNNVDLIRLRSRDNPGNPLWTVQFKGHERDKMTHLLDCVHWHPHPEVFPEITVNGSTYFTTARTANWTNNPFLANTDWLRLHILPRLGGDIEKQLQPWWEKQDFKIAQSTGLFTHYRID